MAFGMTMWYFFQNHTQLQFKILRGHKLLNPCHKKKTKLWCMWSYSTRLEPSCTTLDLRSWVVLLGTQLVEYGPTYHTIIWCSLRTRTAFHFKTCSGDCFLNKVYHLDWIWTWPASHLATCPDDYFLKAKSPTLIDAESTSVLH